MIQKMLGNMPPIGQIAIANALRTVPRGWTLDQRRAYFTFLTEARTLANLKHPGLIEIYDIHRANVPFIAMEFLEGQNMGDMLRSRALTLGRALYAPGHDLHDL